MKPRLPPGEYYPGVYHCARVELGELPCPWCDDQPEESDEVYPTMCGHGIRVDGEDTHRSRP